MTGVRVRVRDRFGLGFSVERLEFRFRVEVIG